jgi:hypothetical protein
MRNFFFFIFGNLRIFFAKVFRIKCNWIYDCLYWEPKPFGCAIYYSASKDQLLYKNLEKIRDAIVQSLPLQTHTTGGLRVEVFSQGRVRGK